MSTETLIDDTIVTSVCIFGNPGHSSGGRAALVVFVLAGNSKGRSVAGARQARSNVSTPKRGRQERRSQAWYGLVRSSGHHAFGLRSARFDIAPKSPRARSPMPDPDEHAATEKPDFGDFSSADFARAALDALAALEAEQKGQLQRALRFGETLDVAKGCLGACPSNRIFEGSIQYIVHTIST